MTEIPHSEQLKWVQSGNFPSFCFISPQYKSLEELKFNFDSLRENLMQYKTPVSEIQESWFDMNEFVEYVQHTEPQIYLTETMSMASRMKMKREAHKNSKTTSQKTIHAKNDSKEY